MNEKVIDDITEVRDESDRDGMRIVIELKRGSEPQIVLNQLYKHTQMQESFSMIFLAVVNGQPKELPLHVAIRRSSTIAWTWCGGGRLTCCGRRGSGSIFSGVQDCAGQPGPRDQDHSRIGQPGRGAREPVVLAEDQLGTEIVSERWIRTRPMDLNVAAGS